ncbi:glycosyltransferase family 2 protein, partial [Patescibacteria group bacterium]|nr:glycosyltransferase family 2 protein [Patescibacteria group bacterium]
MTRKFRRINEISVFFPAFNEEANIEKTVRDAVKVLKKIVKKWEVIIVNDGSRDKTLQVAKKLGNEDTRIRVINHKDNKGYGEALKSGFYNAKYDWIAMVDADGQFDFGEITKLIEKTKNADVVVGYRMDRKDPMIRRLFGWGWTLLANIILGINVSDVDCSFKLVNKKVIKNIPKLESTRGGMISPELLAKAKKAGFTIDQVGVHHYSRNAGHQTGADLN